MIWITRAIRFAVELASGNGGLCEAGPIPGPSRGRIAKRGGRLQRVAVSWIERTLGGLFPDGQVFTLRAKGVVTMAAKFELFTDKAGKFRWHLKAANGEVIAASQAYESKAAAKNGIESVQKNAPGAPTEDQS
ncbi:hypothetical protein GCM10023319_25790 [Nocardia iowensis]